MRDTETILCSKVISTTARKEVSQGKDAEMSYEKIAERIVTKGHCRLPGSVTL